MPAVLPCLLESMIDLELTRARWRDGKWYVGCRFVLCDPTGSVSGVTIDLLPLTDRNAKLDKTPSGPGEREPRRAAAVLHSGRAVCRLEVAPWKQRQRFYRFQVAYRCGDRDVVTPPRKLQVVYELAGSPDQNTDWLGGRATR